MLGGKHNVFYSNQRCRYFEGNCAVVCPVILLKNDPNTNGKESGERIDNVYTPPGVIVRP
jgi:hypothetical protein